jgi:Carbohydrate-selective porin
MVTRWVFILSALSCLSAFGQESPKDLLEINTAITGDLVTNFSGGIKQGSSYIGKEEITLSFNAEKARLWKDGCFFIHALNTHGTEPSIHYTGDIQIISNLEAGYHTSIFELYYKQQLGRFWFLIGQHEMNTEFIGVRYSGLFLNSSFGVLPLISLNVPVSIYPLAAPAFIAKYESPKNIIFRLGVYDGDPGSFENNRYNLKWSISADEGFFNIGELEYVQKNGETETGSYKIGSYYHTGYFKNYSDTMNAVKGNYGVYAMVDKDLFPRSFSSLHGICAFLQFGFTSPFYNMVHFYVGGGIRYRGIIPNRYNDHLGFAFTHVSLSKYYCKCNSQSAGSETALEATYAFHFGGKYCIQPSCQYIINPGSDKNLQNSFAGILRFSLTY